MAVSAVGSMGGFRALVVVALVWLVAVPCRAQVVTPPPEGNFTVMNGADPPQVAVALRPLQGVSKVSASVRRATLNGAPRPTPLVGFVAKYVEANRQLSVEVDRALRSGLAPGVYGLNIELAGEAASGSTPPEPKLVTQLLDLQLTLPPAHLAPIPAIKLSYERGFGTDVPARSIVLTELSGITTIHMLSVRQVEPATNDDWQTDARFELSAAPQPLAAGLTQTVKLVGSAFPLGVTKGQVVVSARELEQPVIVPFEVKARTYSWFIIPVFLAGGLIGWFVRYRLRQLEARAVLEARLAPLLQKVERAKKVAVPQLQSSLGAAQRAVEDALGGSDQGALEAKVAALQAALDAAVAVRASAISDGFKTAADLEKVINTPWVLPQGTAERLAGSPELVAAAEAAFLADDVRGAEKALEEARRRVTEACAVVDDWIGRAKPRVAALVTPSAGLVLPATARDSIQADATHAAEKLSLAAAFDATPLQPTTFAAAAERYLRAAHVAHAAVRLLVQTLHNGFWVAANEAVLLLQNAGRGDGELVKLTAARDLVPRGDPADAIDALRGAVQEFVQELATFIEETPEAEDALAAGDYVGAIRASGAGPNLQISSGPHADRARPPPTEPVPREPAPSVAQTYVLLRPPPGDPVVFTQARLEKVQFLRGAVSASMLAVATWIIYRDAWVGTLGDITGVAVVAFFSDFTLDAVLGTFEKLRKVG